MRILFSFLLIGIVTPADGLEIQYGQSFWNDLNSFGFGQGLPFEQSFQCGKKVSYTSTLKYCDIKCTDVYCERSCDAPSSKEDAAIDLVVEDCKHDQVSIYGSNGYSAIVKREEYESSHNNWFVTFLKSIGKYNQPIDVVYVEHGTPTTVYRMVNGVKVPVRAFYIMGSLKVGSAKSEERFSLYITNEYEGPAQILWFGSELREEYFMKLEGFKWKP